MIIQVQVLTSTGYDTLYAFPGATPYITTGLGNLGNGEVSLDTKLVRNGVRTPDFVMGNYFRYATSVATASAGTDGEITGEISRWGVFDRADPTSAMLLQVTVIDDSQPAYLDISGQQFMHFTPDVIVSSTLFGGGEIEFKFYGGDGKDTLRGTFWNDTLDGGAGADTLIGGDGNDKYVIDKTDKIVELANGGTDTVNVGFNYTLGANLENLIGTGTAKLALTGNSAANIILGSSGNDTIKGQGGNDTIYASGGKDAIYGGTGKDSFVFLVPTTSADVDTVKDFKPADDTVLLLRTNFPSILAYNFNGPLPVDFFRSNKAGQATDGNDFIVYDNDSGALYYDGDGNGTTQQRELIAMFSGHPKLTAADIVIL